nr:MAG TPA_asm: hypothetical protein [Caudoviricetes sp.]
MRPQTAFTPDFSRFASQISPFSQPLSPDDYAYC